MNVETPTTSEGFQMAHLGLNPKKVFRNLPVARLYELALKHEPGTIITSTGALATVSGAKTGRSPRDKRVVREQGTEKEVWWAAPNSGSPNHEMDERSFLLNRETALGYLNSLPHVFVFDGFANWSPESRIKVRVITERAYHALFMSNMLIRPTPAELDDFGEPEFVIYNAGAFPANRYANYMTSSTSVAISLKHREMVILGTEYAGEMKKGVFSYMHYLMPKRGILSLHSGCNVGHDGDVTLFFGLSGTGKTTLSTEPHRPLIGDDEHCWGDGGVFNIEGGCYAKCIGLQANSEPEIFKAIRFGAVLENVMVKGPSRQVHYASSALTENTRASYPITYIDNARIPCVGPHPRNVVLLCCDAFGVLPPVSRLTLEQAMYHFISGYTSKVAGTEMGITEPEATFSACYGGAFLMWHPMKYAAMLAERMSKHGTKAWLVNTGWTGGSYGVGRRMSLRKTRAIIDAIHSGELSRVETAALPLFGLQVPVSCHGVPHEELQPHKAWGNEDAYNSTLTHLARLFVNSFKQYLEDAHEHVGSELAERILTGGPDGAQLEAYEAKHEPLSGSKLGTTGAPKTAAAKAEGPAMAAAAGVLALAQLVAA
ncbi:phosphoenolpyruvate carboxykinase (ATP) [Monoraphidium neglectum]|uniref:phosphoenolpyruvate carboxykinase (ATP) n=1 Tax=Monoraphidium neglectum TaxID=145388 RepID=A0A0D2MSD0_9CHLO|nr:phosphoenolpyruvate carboxykinase (ATP) [Monoraphidium neglectum]KIZ05455.1 phosphoenolpyruvate carboxykinase (ATP) [Monoraphidium neglectum]|eukprot:XP_013904474.1 phosphoenolpyruvate carboxykinase (ATP) [Monoraphidium neglectum]